MNFENVKETIKVTAPTVYEIINSKFVKPGSPFDGEPFLSDYLGHKETIIELAKINFDFKELENELKTSEYNSYDSIQNKCDLLAMLLNDLKINKKV